MTKRMGLILSLLVLAITTVQAARPLISNVHATQRTGTRLVDVWYSVSDSDSDQMNISVRFNDSGRLVSAFSFTKDVRTNPAGGKDEKIIWDAGSSWPGPFSNLTVTVSADDGYTQSVSASCPVSRAEQTVTNQSGRTGKPTSGNVAPISRFTDHGDGTVTDNQTGLEWVRSPQSLSGNSGTMVWTNAMQFCNELVYADHSDWRLPSRTELMGLVDCTQNSPALPAGHPFAVQNSHYWSSSTTQSNNTGFAWFVNMHYGYESDYYTALSFYVWPVRGKQ